MAVAWPSGVNKRILRSGSWGECEGFTEDTTLSGKTKRRRSLVCQKREFSVKMRMNTTEYALFRTWYTTVCLYGLYSFTFPKIDASSGTSEYRFKKGGAPKYSNAGGVYIDVSMTWEEV